ncbi:tetratricopeptide (TPR) repeat protein [Nocardioides albus]|uniref:Tetratricopeptide (TPR) repeat protein n=1 Tax=Nocardioides albus TaxID=1841 RepID=A0A7W5A9B9_9ACTN|nr:tetratricopeptide (TPR) repeat protein [Nocardioides albus]
MDALADALELTGAGRADFLSGSGRVEERSVAAPTDLVPRQLPPRLMSFVGRTEEVGVLDDVVARVATDRHSDAGTVVVTMSGLPGIGKTALAVEWGHRAASRFPDGQLYLNLRGFDAKNEPLSSGEALRELLTSLGVAESKICRGLGARIGQYRTLVSAMRILVILDNVVDPDQVRPLLPVGAGSAALVLSRHRLPGLVAQVGAVPVSLGVLRPAEACQLISSRLSSSARARDVQMEELQPLVDMCSGLPLALALIASRAQLDPGAISEYAARSVDDQTGLAVLSLGDRSTSFESILVRSIDSLSKEARDCFILIGLGASSEFSIAEVASLRGHGRIEARSLIDELMDASLVQAAGGGRMTLHDLLWEFVVREAQREVPEDVANLCRKRLLDYLIHNAVAATATFAPHRTRPDLSQPAVGVVLEEFRTPQEGRAWMESTLDTALAAVGHGVGWGLLAEVAWLAEGVSAYLDIQGRWTDLLTTEEAALRAGEMLDDAQIQALACRRMAIAQARVGEVASAEDSARRAIRLYSRFGDISGEAHAHRLLGGLLEESCAHESALEHRREALSRFEILGDEAATAMALNAVGWSHALLGEFDVALDYCLRSTDTATRLGHSRSIAAAWDSVGFIARSIGDRARAENAYDHALASWRASGERYYLARTYESVAGLRAETGDQRGAIDALETALDLYDELGSPEIDRIQGLLAELADSTAREDEAGRVCGTGVSGRRDIGSIPAVPQTLAPKASIKGSRPGDR